MRSALIVFFIAVALSATGQYHCFLNLGVEDGLAQSQVNDAHQDSSGYLWISTASGLSRFDGTEIDNFYKSDGLVDNITSCIIESNSGVLYIGGSGGLSTYDGQIFRPYTFPKGILDSRVQCLELTNDSTLWVATNRDGYFSLNLNTGVFSEPIIEQGKNVRWFDIAGGWVAGSAGLYRHGVIVDPMLADVSVSDVVFEGEDIWVSTLGYGIFHFRDGLWQSLRGQAPVESEFTRDLMLASDGVLWLVGPEGALTLSTKGWRFYNRSHGLEYLNMRHIDEDREGNIWLCSNGQGIYRFTGEVFETYRRGSPLISELMLSMTEYEGKLYLGMFDDTLQILSPPADVQIASGMFQTDIWAQLTDSQGRLWAGTSAGLYRSVDGAHYERVFQDRIPSNRVTSLFEDEYANIWVGHRDGISVIYGDTEIEHYTSETGFDGKRVRAIQASQDGAIWVGAQNGLFRIADDWILHLGEESGLNDNTIYSIQDDSYGRMWIGAKNGLHILQEDSVMQVMVSGRVDANNINFLKCTKAGNLFVGTNQGLFHAAITADVGDMIFRRYGIADGLPGLECNLNSVFQDSKSELWFGTDKGIVRFNEERLLEQSALKAPSLRITDLLLFAEPISIASYQNSESRDQALSLTFEPDENHITIAFKGVRLKSPEGIRYQYYLEGLDRDWLPASQVRSVTYSSLGFGDYTFKVRCVDATGTQIGDMVSAHLSIKAPVYLRWWAILLQLIILSAIVYAILRWRKIQRDRENSMVELSYKNRMQSLERASLNSSMNRHFIFNSLNAIQFYINREDKRAANKYLSSFAKLIRKNLDSTSQAWVTLADELERLELYLSLEHMRFKEKFSYHIDIDAPIIVEEVKVPAMMLQPFVENSIWHGILPKEEPGQVKIEVKAMAGRLRIRIEDDGIGIAVSRQKKSSMLPDHESKGMDITHHRLRLYGEMTGSDFEVQGPAQLDGPDGPLGTRIDLFIPLEEEAQE